MKQTIINAALAIAAIFAPIQKMIATVIVLVLFDLVTGIIASKKQGIPITSAGVRRTITKLFVFLAALCLGFLTQQHLTGESIPVSNIVASLIGLTELLSCMENLNIIGGGDLLKSVLEKLNSQNK